MRMAPRARIPSWPGAFSLHREAEDTGAVRSTAIPRMTHIALAGGVQIRLLGTTIYLRKRNLSLPQVVP